MKKYIPSIVLALISGLFMVKIIFNQYDNKQNIKTIFNAETTIYLVRVGIFSSIESMETNCMDLNYYIYNIQDGQYYVYVGITENMENYNKIAGYFKTLGYDNYKTEISIKNDAFIENLRQYDLLLEETTDNKIIDAICSQVLTKYEELVIGED